MTVLTRRHAAIATLTLTLSIAAIVVGVTAPTPAARAQANPSLLAQQPPASCVCAPAIPVFGGSSGPQIANCQCGALNCAAATAAGGVALQCSR